MKNYDEASLVEGTESQITVTQNQVQQNEVSHDFSTENQTKDINSNMPNNSETSVERQEPQIHEQSQQNSQQSQQPGAFRIYPSYLDSSRVEETKDESRKARILKCELSRS